MKKLLILMLSLSMTLCFTACGGSKDETADTTQESDAAAVDTTTDTVADTTADTAAADYSQILTFVESITTHDALLAELTTYRASYDAGELTIDDLNNAYLNISNDSQTILATLQGTTWTSDTYSDQIALLTEAIEALAQAETLNYDAIINNNEDKLTEGDTYMSTYKEKMDALLTALGV